MSIELILALTALFVAASGFLIAVLMSFRVYRLEREVELLKRAESTSPYLGSVDDVPAFLRHQAD